MIKQVLRKGVQTHLWVGCPEEVGNFIKRKGGTVMEKKGMIVAMVVGVFFSC